MTTTSTELKNLTEMWKFYNEYYIEKFGEALTESEQKKYMKILTEASVGNEEKAMKILGYLIDNGKKSMYAVTDEQLKDEYIADNDLNE